MPGTDPSRGVGPASPAPVDRRHANRLRSQVEYAGGATRLIARPRFLVVELTRRCNLSCGMCRPAGYNGAAPSMSPDLFRRLERELFPFAEIVDLRGWGESLILPEFEDRLARTAATGAAVRIVTNLSFRRPRLLDALAEIGAHVGISIDSADAATLHRLRGGARLALIESNLRQLSGAMARHGFGDRLCIYATCQAANLDGLGDIVELAARCGVHDVRFAPVTIAASSPLALPQDPVRLHAALTDIAARAAGHGVRASLTARLSDRAEPKGFGDPCLHPWTHCYVAADGRVGFCDHLIGPEGDPYLLGDLRETSFEAIWNGSAWVALRDTHVRDRRPAAPHFHECSWCYRNRFIDSEDLLEPALAGKRVSVARAACARGAGR